MAPIEIPNIVTIDGKQYQTDSQTDHIKEMIALYQLFSADVREARITLTKSELAREAIGIKIANAIKADELSKTSDDENDQEPAALSPTDGDV